MTAFQIYTDIFFNWQTLLDIFLIAAGIFFLYRMILRLGSWYILVGILIALVIFAVARLLNLEGIVWVFRNVSQVALLASIIIFQPELRKIFDKVVSLAVGKRTKLTQTTAATIAESLWLLAQQKRGALIVLPGAEPIHDKTSGGYILKAVPSVPLLMSIFDPNSPGHDGAVIVAGNLLTHLAVRLPISESGRLSDEYGTRHHSAMGMSEKTDSLIFVVSEERGMVSSFLNGKMSRLTSEEQVIAEIDRHFQSLGIIQAGKKIFVERRTLLQGGASILIAAFFWSTFILSEKQMVERTLKIPIEYTSPGDGKLLVGERMDELTIHAAGPKSAMDDFALSFPIALIDLSKMTGGEQVVYVTADNIKRPKAVTLLDISPSEINLTLASLVQKNVPISPQLIGNLPNGLKIKSIHLIPEGLKVFAPSARRDQKQQALSTSPIYLNSITNDSSIFTKIIAPPSYQPVGKNWPDVEVIITLE